MRGERGCNGSPTPPFMHLLTMALHFHGRSGLLLGTAPFGAVPHSSPFTLFPQPTSVLSLGLSSRPRDPAPSPRPYQWMRVSDWGVQGSGRDRLCRSVSVVPATNQLLHSPLSLFCSLSVPGDLPSAERASQGVKTFPLFQLPPYQGHRSCPSTSFFFFFFHPTLFHGDVSCPFRYLRSSASVQ